MIRYISENRSLVFNEGRRKAFKALRHTLDELAGKPGVTELELKSTWIDNMKMEGELFTDGWYSPPPSGAAVLCGDRVRFDALRNAYNWSGERIVDWHSDPVFFYASPVDRNTGLIGDCSMTIYMGGDERIRAHFSNCRRAARELFSELDSFGTAAELFERSQEIFEAHRLKSLVISRTDDQPINLGHTFTRLEGASEANVLTPEQKCILSSRRRFVNASASWCFENGIQFSVEPQLVSVDDDELPKVTQHYLVCKEPGGFIVCDDIDMILEELKL